MMIMISKILNDAGIVDEKYVHSTNVITLTAIASPTALQPPMRSWYKMPAKTGTYRYTSMDITGILPLTVAIQYLPINSTIVMTR